jgi:hypothetical protein
VKLFKCGSMYLGFCFDEPENGKYGVYICSLSCSTVGGRSAVLESGVYQWILSGIYFINVVTFARYYPIRQILRVALV